MKLIKFAALASILALGACDNATSDPAALQGKSFYVVENGTPVTIVFAADDARVNGRVVNLYNGSYEISGNKIKFGPIATTMMMGPESAMATEREYLQFLDTVETYNLTGEQLVLKGADGRELVFQEVELTEDAEPVTPTLPEHARPIMRIEDINK